MRWNETELPKQAETRTIKRFLLLPLCIGNEYRWLEMASIKQWWCDGSGIDSIPGEWNNSAWVD